ncbi:MAG: class I SAM-dependent methyltransferase, partial [Candidatus Methylarchaceae archaeon HK02M1]|nr:class I SAM-dependent methyltransferase [Candidatus Methylarchaceae archaeon HK02M1]
MPNQDEPNVDMKELFNMPFHYQLHSYTQKKQAEFLIFLIKQYVNYFNIKTKLILDVGCGTGAITKYIWRDHFPEARIVGVDISESMITKAREDLPRNYNIEYLCSSIEDFQYPNKFDVAFTNATMHWIK